MDALVKECCTQYAWRAPESAEAVISAGREAVPALRAADEGADDPDMLVWVRVCLRCIENGWTLEQCKDRLREEMRARPAEGWLRAATWLNMMHDPEALAALTEENHRLGRGFQFDIDLWVRIGGTGKRSYLPRHIVGLVDPRNEVRDAAYKVMFARFQLDFGRDWDATEEGRRAVQEAFMRAWTERYYELEAARENGRRTGGVHGDYVKNFQAYRHIFE
ncbi:MAG: hypothetical protein HY608_01760 [Planctomycetes bacterium]|nr:hypothetical protein [Planctomycetota bacterium]